MLYLLRSQQQDLKKGQQMKHEIILSTAKVYLTIGAELEKKGIDGRYYFSLYNKQIVLYNKLKKEYLLKEYEVQQLFKRAA